MTRIALVLLAHVIALGSIYIYGAVTACAAVHRWELAALAISSLVGWTLAVRKG